MECLDLGNDRYILWDPREIYIPCVLQLISWISKTLSLHWVVRICLLAFISPYTQIDFGGCLADFLSDFWPTYGTTYDQYCFVYKCLWYTILPSMTERLWIFGCPISKAGDVRYVWCRETSWCYHYGVKILEYKTCQCTPHVQNEFLSNLCPPSYLVWISPSSYELS